MRERERDVDNEGAGKVERRSLRVGNSQVADKGKDPTAEEMKE